MRIVMRPRLQRHLEAKNESFKQKYNAELYLLTTKAMVMAMATMFAIVIAVGIALIVKRWRCGPRFVFF